MIGLIKGDTGSLDYNTYHLTSYAKTCGSLQQSLWIKYIILNRIVVFIVFSMPSLPTKG